MPKKHKTVSGTPTDWQAELADVTNDTLTNEQQRRLALEKKVTEIPDNVISAELERRREEWMKRPFVFHDL